MSEETPTQYHRRKAAERPLVREYGSRWGTWMDLDLDLTLEDTDWFIPLMAGLAVGWFFLWYALTQPFPWG